MEGVRSARHSTDPFYRGRSEFPEGGPMSVLGVGMAVAGAPSAAL